MKKLNHLTNAYLLFIVILTACNTDTLNVKEEIKMDNSFKGAWEMLSVDWITVDTTYSIKNAQPGLYMFSDNNYTIMWTPIEEPRVPFKILSQPTDEEIISGFRSVVFNGGNYVSTDSTITTTATIAKVPGFEGGKQLYDYKIIGDTLNLTMFDEIYPDGSKPDWSGTFKTKFTMKRL